MKNYETLQECIKQLEKCDYQTVDGLHSLKMNTAFIQLKEYVELNYIASKMIKTLLEHGYKYDEMPKIFQYAKQIHKDLNILKTTHHD